MPGGEDPTYECTGNPYDAFVLANITGFPDVQVPAGFTKDGLPISISFFGRAYSEPDLLGFAYDYEQATLNRRLSPLVPPLPSKSVPEPGTTGALALVGVGALVFKLKQKYRLRN